MRCERCDAPCNRKYPPYNVCNKCRVEIYELGDEDSWVQFQKAIKDINSTHKPYNERVRAQRQAANTRMCVALTCIGVLAGINREDIEAQLKARSIRTTHLWEKVEEIVGPEKYAAYINAQSMAGDRG